jgi:hypothetical protein
MLDSASRGFMLLVTRYPSSLVDRHLAYFFEEWNRLPAPNLNT